MGAESVTLQSMDESDLPQVMAIENASFSAPFSENLFRMELRLDVAHLSVAKLPKTNEGGSPSIVGYIDYWKVGGEIHLITLAVQEDFRRKGVAKKLMQRMMEDAARSGSVLVTLDVRVSNEAAIRLYEGFGFLKAGFRKKYYQDNQEDALVMTLTPEKKHAP